MIFLRTVYRTCSRFRNYREFRDGPVTSALKYIVKLVTVLSLVGLLSLLVVGREYVENSAQWIDRNLPPFSIENARVMTDAPQPYRVGDEKFMFILDTTGETRQPETNAVRGILVGADTVTFWARQTNTMDALVRTQQAELRGFPDGAVNGDYFRRLIKTFAWVGVPVGFVILMLTALLTVLVQAYIFALIASLMERNQPKGLRLPQLLNIAIHAATPAALVYTVYQALRLQHLDLWLVYLVIYGVYVVGAANACREQRPVEETEGDGLL